VSEEPFSKAKAAWVFTSRKIPSRCEVVPASTYPATFQKTLEATPPPVRVTFAPLPAIMF